MSYQHAVVWLDHLRAVVIDFSRDSEHVHLVPSDTEQRQIHRKTGGDGGNKATEDHKFFDDIVAAIGDAREVLVVGPGQAKVNFRKDLDHRHPKTAALVVAVEPMDHPTMEELLSHARKYFKRVDALRGDL
ncbi:MAG: translational machinery protein [Actinomycetota bacterium]